MAENCSRSKIGRLARWIIKLSPYHLIIQHRPGRSNLNGDFLSRYPMSQATSDSVKINAIDSALNILKGTTILDDIRVEQYKDPRLACIIQALTDTPLLPFGDKHGPYILVNNILYLEFDTFIPTMNNVFLEINTYSLYLNPYKTKSSIRLMIILLSVVQVESKHFFVYHLVSISLQCDVMYLNIYSNVSFLSKIQIQQCSHNISHAAPYCQSTLAHDGG